MAQLVSGELQYLMLYKAFESRQTGSIELPGDCASGISCREEKEDNLGGIRGMAATHWPLLI